MDYNQFTKKVCWIDKNKDGVKTLYIQSLINGKLNMASIPLIIAIDAMEEYKQQLEELKEAKNK